MGGLPNLLALIQPSWLTGRKTPSYLINYRICITVKTLRKKLPWCWSVSKSVRFVQCQVTRLCLERYNKWGLRYGGGVYIICITVETLRKSIPCVSQLVSQ